MKFEVLDRDGIVKMSTEHKRCIYPVATLKSMEAAGYKFRINGKRWKPGQVYQPEIETKGSKKK